MKWIWIIFLIFCGMPVLKAMEDSTFKKSCDMVQVKISKIRSVRYIESLLISLILPFNFIMVLALGGAYKRHEWMVQQKINDRKQNLNLQFSMWLRLMEVLLAYNTVPVAIEKSIENAPDLMISYLNDLSEALKVNPLNQDIYTSFMQEYEDLAIERAMHHLYRYAYMGTQDASVQLSNLIEDNAENLKQHRLKLLEKRLNFFSWYGLIPMFLVSITFLGLMFIVLTNLMKGGWQT